MRLSKFTPSLCTVEGGVFRGMYFYHRVFHFLPLANAPFGSSFWSRRPYLAVPSTRHSTALLRFPCKHCAGRGCGGWGGLGGRSGLRVGGLLGSHWFALLARCAALFACLVCCFVLAFGCLCPAGLLFLLQLAPLWFVFVPAEGNRFALGTGGIRWSLLVGGLGPVLSIPKLCFKPFRSGKSLLELVRS